MPLAEVVTIEVGAAIAKYILKLWLKDGSLGNDIASNVVDILKSKTSDKLAQRKGNRQFEIIGEKVGESLLPFFEREGARLDEGDSTAIAYAVAEAFNQSTLSSEILVKYNLEPAQLSQLIFVTYPTTIYGFSIAATEFYQRIINEACTYIVDIASQLPSFTEHSFAEVLKREDMIITKVDQVLADLEKIREQLDPMIEAEHFEIEYRQAVARNLDILQLIGADVSPTNRRHKLSVAYITLSVQQKRSQFSIRKAVQSNSAESETVKDTVSINSTLASSRRLLILGLAGSGKTTLLQWISVRAATKTFEGELTHWNTYLPFYIRLRRYVQTNLPRPEVFPEFSAPAIVDTMPKGWVYTKLKSEGALVLVDGIDEVPASQREEVHTWLNDLVDTFPQANFIVTSRPHAIHSGWMNHHNFDYAELQPMGLSDISTFIDHWHHAVQKELQLDEEKSELEPLAIHLKELIRWNHAIRTLATNPLLCALLCALNRERRRYLPVNRIELYRACCSLLLERRDKESRVDMSDYPALTLGQKERVLQDLAYWMIQENLSEADTIQVDEHFTQQLTHMPNLPQDTTGEKVRRLLVERSGILREPVAGYIDFAHRTFEEFFAAQSALDAMDIVKLVANAHNDQWREVIINASGLASKAVCEQLVTGLIKRGDKEKEYRHQLHLLAVSCLETAIQLSTKINIEVEHRLSQLVPPKNMIEAHAVAAAGELAVKHLTKKGKTSETVSAACVRALATIGSITALDVLEEYATDTREIVVNELLKAWEMFDRDTYAMRILSKTFRHQTSLRLERTSSLDGIQYITNLTTLNLAGCSQLSDLTPLAGLTNLTTLDLSSCSQLSDLTPLAGLTTLTTLDLSSCSQLSDLIPLAGLTNLTTLNLTNCSQLSDLTPIAGLINLTTLNLAYSSQLSDLIPLVGLTNLTTLNLSNNSQLTTVILTGLTNLTTLNLFNNSQLTTVTLTGLTNLTKLYLANNSQLTTVTLTGLTNLTSLNLNGCSQLTTITFRELTNLTKLYLADCSQLSDLTPLAGLTNLITLNLADCIQLSDLTPLASLSKLTTLYLGDSRQISDLTLTLFADLSNLHIVRITLGL